MADKNYSKTVESGQRLKVKSALNPVLWMCGLISAPTFGYGALNPNLPTWLIIIGSAPVIVALYSYIFFMHRDPDRLQSEEFQIQKRTIELAQQKGEPPSDPRNLEIASNPVQDCIKHDAGQNQK
ncbi:MULTISPECIES: hypothetical protein [unclassified Pseudomonas]|uniref:hypothetical protein n=1 Tax=unclassified Pseudomonas TaxID=196821 RepID=UPI0011B0C037|nr:MULTISPECIES: hypothetical protein [unclassified Pseudomonas]